MFSAVINTDEIYCGIHHNRNKIFKRNKKEYEKLAEHIGSFPVVMISPEDVVPDYGRKRRTQEVSEQRYFAIR